MIKKGLAVAVILLFIGVAFAPSINADVSKQDELVDFDVEFCGFGQKHTVSLTQEETDDLTYYLEEVKKQFQQVDSREEADMILKDAVVELEKFGLLGKLSVKRTQRLVTGEYQKSLKSKYNEKSSTDYIHINSNCVLIGDFIGAQDFFNIFILLGQVPLFFGNVFEAIDDYLQYYDIQAYFLSWISNLFSLIFYTINLFLFDIGNLKPFHLFEVVYLDYLVPSQVKSFISYGDNGWQNYTSPDNFWSFNMVGFTGISIIINRYPLEEFYLGHAFEVNSHLDSQ